MYQDVNSFFITLHIYIDDLVMDYCNVYIINVSLCFKAKNFVLFRSGPTGPTEISRSWMR